MAVSRVGIPPGYHALQFESPLFSIMGAVQPGHGLVGLTGAGVLPHQGDLNPGTCLAWHQFVFKASTHLLSALSGVYGPFSPSGYYAFTFSLLSEPLGKRLERYSS